MAARPLLLSLHGGAGALFGVLLFVVLFSGAWSLGHDDLREWLRAPAQAGGEALALERLLERAGEEGVDIGDATLLLPAPGHAAFSVCDARLDCRLDLDPASGRVLPPTPALDLLLNLHKSLFVGFPGRVLVSLFGVSLLLLCLAGVLLHSRRWRDLRRWRRDRGLRLALFDLHGLIGIWGLPWLLLFGFTGALSGLGALGTLLLAPVAYPQEPNRVFVELMGPPPPAAEGRPLASRIDLDRLLAGDAVRAPGFVAQRLSLSHAGDVAGSGRLVAFAYGTLPGVWPQLVAYTLYRWENNIRMASVLGFVGAGGLGQMLYFSLSLFQQAQAATVILAMLVLVLGVDSLSAWARQRWVSQ